MRVLIGLAIVFSLSTAYAGESEPRTSNTVDPSRVCIYESQYYSEGSLVNVSPVDPLYIKCEREKFTVKGVDYQLIKWIVLGSLSKHNEREFFNQKDAPDPKAVS